MKKTFNFGKVAYANPKVRNCPVTVEVELKDGENGKCFSASGMIWNHIRSDCYSGGQNLEEIRSVLKNNKLFNEIYSFWKKYHLNDMEAGCEHQRELGWENIRIDPKELPDTIANRDEKGILAMWVREDEHPKGVLSKPCPVCGYKYGSAWLHRPIPKDDLERIEKLLSA